MTTLVACSHGTADLAGAAAVTRLVEAVRRRAGVPVVEAHVDVHPPYLADVAPQHSDVVVVPLLLAAGYHAHVDVARVVDDHPSAAQADALGCVSQFWPSRASFGACDGKAPERRRAGGPSSDGNAASVRAGRRAAGQSNWETHSGGPDPRITALLLERLHAAGLRPDDTVVLAAAGSSDDAADVSVRRTAEALGAHLDRPVTVAYGAARTPRVADEVARLRAEQPGRRLVLASYLLATGHFHRRLVAAGADVVSAPLLDGPVVDARLVEVVLDRYAVTARSRCTAGRRHAATRERPRSGGR